ncbi:MAG: L,D-transpeptidase family protein [Fimbriimonadaceae bacterium]|nr:L,D-transpeptidase family protein [Alphaproteobacteria bacterium]
MSYFHSIPLVQPCNDRVCGSLPRGTVGFCLAHGSMRKFAIVILALLVFVAVYRFWPDTLLQPGVQADRIVTFKPERRLALMKADRVLKDYTITLGWDPIGAKQQLGDGRTPEGTYRIDWKQRQNDFHLALDVSYPDANDRASASRQGVDPGGAIMIYGMANGWGWIGRLHRFVDWTNGCIAVTDKEIEEL